MADQSTPEKDKYELNDLYERAQKYGDAFEKNLKSLPFLFNTVQPRAFIYLHHDPYHRNQIPELSYEEFRKILCATTPNLSSSIPFDTTHSTQNGFIARQVANNEPSSDVMSFRWYANGNATIEIPLNKFHQADSDKYIYLHDMGRQFQHYLRSSGHHSASVIDFSLLQGAMAAAITQYEALLKSINADKNYYLKARLINVGGLIPFFPSEKYLEQLEEFGTPIIRDEELWIPYGTTIDSLMEGKMAEDAPPTSGYVLSVFVLHVCGILPSFGVDELVDIITAASKAATVTRTNLENST